MISQPVLESLQKFNIKLSNALLKSKSKSIVWKEFYLFSWTAWILFLTDLGSAFFLGFFFSFPHDLLSIKLEPWEGSVAASSHVFTRACNMNGALSGCRKGGKVHLTGPNLNGE